jgi:hypothetical protein
MCFDANLTPPKWAGLFIFELEIGTDKSGRGVEIGARFGGLGQNLHGTRIVGKSTTQI